MSDSRSDSYAAAGVDITAGYRAVSLMKSHIAKTMTAGVISDIGGFGGLFEPDLTGIKKPVLVSGTDGVGTKLRLAFLTNRHDTVGIDCVAMCVNDIICCGAKPLFFLDYIACGKNVPEKIADVVSEYDLAGFSVGIVDKEKIVDNSAMSPGDVILALPSSGVHSNGFSLVRRVFGVETADLSAPVAELGGASLGETLLTPTKIYVRPILGLLEKVRVKGISHITGGGFFENIPRCIPEGLGAKIEKAAVSTPPIFHLIAKTGHIPERDMWNTFNMGCGMSVVVAREDADKALACLADDGEDAYVMGEITASDERVLLW